MQAHDTGPKWVGHIAQRLIRYRGFLVGAFLLITVALAWTAMQLRTDAAFTKMIPLNHPFMQVFLKYQDVFGGANRVLVSIAPRKGDIYTAETLELLRTITEEGFFIEGVERSSVTSLFTPNVRYNEVVEEGFRGGNIVSADFQGLPEQLEQKLHHGFLQDRNHRLGNRVRDGSHPGSLAGRQDHRLHRRRLALMVRTA